jgi:diguanylate cyclase (GGDEF)-like protein
MVVPGALTTSIPTPFADPVPPFKLTRRGSSRRGLLGGRLASTVLGHLPLGVLVIDAGRRLLFWNEQAARLFGASPVTAADMPHLGELLLGVVNLTPKQRDGILAFATTHIEAGDRTEPESCLRVSLGRDRRFAIQIRGIGSGRWMLLIDDGKLAVTAGRAATDGGVAWLDSLTGLSNRRHFNRVLRELLENASSGSKHAVLMVDLDQFKFINETLGHHIGDALLCLVAQRLSRETREDDLLSRLGGDEFIILISNGEMGERLAARMVDILSRPFLVEGHIVNIGASIGIARFPEHGASADDLVRYAELALYEAKSAGRHTWRVFDPALATQAHARRDLETGLRRALALNELSLLYQPRWNVQTRALAGFEAVLSWNHPTLGNVSPALFIPVAEEIGCLPALGELVLNTACKDAARWPALAVAVKVSPRQLEDGETLLSAIQAALETSGLAAERLEVEITEGSLLSPAAPVVETLHRLRAHGILIAMSDFGNCGFSQTQLRSFPFDRIKIAQSLSVAAGTDAVAAATIHAIVALGAELGVPTIADGVEMADWGMRTGNEGVRQGYPTSQPIPAGEIKAFVSRYSQECDREF